MTVDSPQPIRVLLADDELLVRSGLAMLIDAEDDLMVVGEANDGIQAVSAVADLRPDVIVMDVRMPRMDGVDATRRIVAGTDPVAVLILTTFDDDTAVYQALRAGASGFILKNAAPGKLAEAIRVVAGGDAYLHPTVARRLIDDFAARPDPALPTPEQMQVLTDRELEVLALIAHGLTNAGIAEHLYVTEATVKTHLGRILMKLSLHDRAQAVTAAYKSGLVKPSDQPPSRAKVTGAKPLSSGPPPRFGRR
jgi:DNA-binding NarL/FixJ family response regulator